MNLEEKFKEKKLTLCRVQDDGEVKEEKGSLEDFVNMMRFGVVSQIAALLEK